MSAPCARTGAQRYAFLGDFVGYGGDPGGVVEVVVWHDRAVFHVLTDVKDRAAYVRQVAHAVKPKGHVIVATFGHDGPDEMQRPGRCTL
jgi:hypothetical protein